MSRFVFNLDKSQRKEFAKYLFGLSQIDFGSLAFKLFEPGAPSITLGSLFILLPGLTIGIFLAILGLRFAREEKR